MAQYSHRPTGAVNCFVFDASSPHQYAVRMVVKKHSAFGVRHAVFEAKPDKAQALGRILVDLIAPSRAEPGCRNYAPFADIENSSKFTVVEAWDTKEQWQKHLETSHVAKALGEINAEAMLTQPFTAQQLRSIA